jgi:hypothetical protein
MFSIIETVSLRAVAEEESKIGDTKVDEVEPKVNAESASNIIEGEDEVKK